MKRIIKITKFFLLPLRTLLYYFLLDKLSVLFINNSTNRKGLALVRIDAIGDFILWLDSAKEFRRIYPDRRITLICNEKWAELAKFFNYWDNIIPVNRKRLTRNPFYRFKTLRAIRKQNFEIAIQPAYSREFLLGDSIVRATGAKEKIGSVGDFSNINPREKAISDSWYTKLIPATEKSLMEIERNAEFLINLGIKNFVPKIAYIPELMDIEKLLNINKPYFVVVPGAQWNERRWEKEKFAKIIKEVSEYTGWINVLCGDKNESQLGEEVITISGVPGINIAGKTNLAELVEIIRNAKFVLSNETSAVHISASVGTPSVCILGGGHFGRFLPYPDYLATEKTKLPVVIFNKMNCFGCNWECKHKDYKEGEAFPCIKSISTEQVWRALEILFQVLKKVKA